VEDLHNPSVASLIPLTGRISFVFEKQVCQLAVLNSAEVDDDDDDGGGGSDGEENSVYTDSCGEKQVYKPSHQIYNPKTKI
jgi:hypothetical protein